MRIEHVVARACRRALGWLVPFGMVFAASAGSASAQITVGGPTEVLEGGRVSIPISARVITVLPGSASTTPVTVTIGRESASGNAVTTMGGSSLPTAAEDDDYALSSNSVILRPLSREGATATGSVEIQTNADNDAENEAFVLTFSPSGTAFGSLTPMTNITIDDKETQSFEWELLTSNPTEGQAATVTLTADPSPDDLTWTTNLSVSRAGYTISSGDTTATLASGSAASHQFTVTAEAQDRNRTADTVELRARLSTGSNLPGLEPLSIEFADIHSLPDPDAITWRAYLDSNGSPSTRVATVAVEGGAPVHVTVTVDRGTNGYPLGETLIVTPTVRNRAQLSDFTMEPASIEIASGEGRKSATFRVTALEDADVGPEDLVLDLVVTGKETTNGSGEVSAENPFSIAIGDETTPLVTTKTERQITRTVTVARTAAAGDDGEFTTGEEFSLGTRDLFTSTSPLTLSVQSSDPSVARASAAGDTITVIAVGPGTATITVTGRVVDSATTQTTADAATVDFDVTVDGLDLEITLSAPSDRNLTEGSSITVTATANGAVADDTTITLTPVGGNASPADYSVEPIMIRAGETTGTTTLTATADRDDTERSEELTLEGRFGSNMRTNTLTFTLWDRSIPALPLIAQILLAVFLAVGGYCRYLRRR